MCVCVYVCVCACVGVCVGVCVGGWVVWVCGCVGVGGVPVSAPSPEGSPHHDGD